MTEPKSLADKLLEHQLSQIEARYYFEPGVLNALGRSADGKETLAFIRLVRKLQLEVEHYRTMIQDAHDACNSENMNCPWCEGRIGANIEWHNPECDWLKFNLPT